MVKKQSFQPPNPLLKLKLKIGVLKSDDRRQDAHFGQKDKILVLDITF